MRDRLSPAFRNVVALGATLIASFLLTGCTSTPDVTSYINPVSGRRVDLIGQNLLDAPGNNREMLWLNAYRDYADQYQYTYYLEVIYGARPEAGYLEILPGRSLTIIADNQELNFTGLGSLSRDTDKGALFERARYEATPDDMQRIAHASKVIVQVRGQQGLITREFGADNFERFRAFLAQVDDTNL